MQPSAPGPERPLSWWREPMLWLVIGGPLAVVLAGIATAVIAWRGADTVLRDPPAAASSGSLQPALKARNHAATAG